ncbi:MAG: hypothetical protein ACR2GB_04250 [Nocardioidaceae bacterium]
MAETGGTPSTAIALRRRWYIVVIVVLVAVAGSVAFSLTRTATYSSSAKVLVQPFVSSGSAPVAIDPDEIATQGEVVTSIPVATAVVEQLDLPTAPEDLIGDVTVTTGNTRVITITVVRPNADEAAGIANGLAEAYLSFRDDEAAAQVTALRDSLTQQLTNLKTRLEQIENELAVTEGQSPRLQAERRSTRVQMGQVRSELSRSNESETFAKTAEILLQASPSTKPTGLDPLRTAVLVAILGLVAGGGLALLVERWASMTGPSHGSGGEPLTDIV